MGASLQESLWTELGVSRQIVRALAIVLILSSFVNILILTSPIYMMQIYDRVLVTSQVDTLIYLSLIGLLSLVVMGLIDGARSFMLNRVGRYIDLTLREPTLMRAITLSRLKPGNQRKLIEDLSTMRNYIGSPAIVPFIDAPWVPFFVVIISLLHPWMGILAAGSAVLLFALALANDLMTRRALRLAQTQHSSAMEFADAAIQNSEAVLAMGMQPSIARRYREQIDKMGDTTLQAGDIGAGIAAVSKVTRTVVQSAALGLGAYLVIRAEMTPGGMIAASIILGRALAPIEQTIGSWRQALAARDAYTSVKAQMTNTPVTEEHISLPTLRGRLAVENVSLQLPGAARPILRNISFAVEPGTIVALVGPSASGKSTLCRVLVGANMPSIGTVRLDGANIAGLSPEDLQRSVGYLPQSIDLFAGTVSDNIARLRVPDEAAVVEAARRAGCHEMILRLPNGYETELGPRGLFLSAGQRQRIGFARALYGDPCLLVLDEPNANLDQDGERVLVEAIAIARQRMTTVILVSHRTALLRPADKVALLRDGVLERFGDRSEVVQDAGGQTAPSNLTPIAGTVRQGGAS